jgi:hypothetical protein
MERVSTYNGYMDINTHLVLEFSNHITETFGSRADLGVIEPILDVHGNCLSIF